MGDVIEILQNMTNVCVHPSPAVYEEVQNTWMPVCVGGSNPIVWETVMQAMCH